MSKRLAEQRAGGLRGSHAFSYADIFRASPFDRIAVVKAGVPARKVKQMFAELALDQHVLIDALSLKTATLNRKAARDEALSADESERVIGLASLIGQVEAMVEQSGEAKDFDAPSWLARWLREPLPALGGRRPIELLDTLVGQGLVARMLAQIDSGAYA